MKPGTQNPVRKPYVEPEPDIEDILRMFAEQIMAADAPPIGEPPSAARRDKAQRDTLPPKDYAKEVKAEHAENMRNLDLKGGKRAVEATAGGMYPEVNKDFRDRYAKSYEN